jgi:hypothetical protein
VAGHIDAVGPARLPWVATIAVPAGLCLYFTRQSADGLVIRTAIAPDGTVFRSSGPTLITPTIAGWYTIQLDSAPPSLEQIFDFEFGFRASGDCNPGTPGR